MLRKLGHRSRTLFDRPAGGRLAVNVEITAVTGIGEVSAGDDLAALIAAACPPLRSRDCVVVTQKVVSKAEGRVVAAAGGPEALSRRKRELIEGESVRVLRRRGELVIAETRHGFVCANAGVDFSNVPGGRAALLPVDSDRSARRIRDGLRALTGAEVAVVVSDTFGRPWRRGLTDVAIGCAGIAAVVDLRGTADAGGRELAATETAVADEIAAAADLVMGKARGVPAAVIRGLDEGWFRAGSVAGEIVRPSADDLFR